MGRMSYGYGYGSCGWSGTQDRTGGVGSAWTPHGEFWH